MKLNFKLITISLVTIALLFSFKIGIIFAQSQQTVETTVGTVGSGGGLKPGEFRPPFKCGLSYVGMTYHGHSPYAVDFNRAPFGAEDLGDPVRAAADGEVAYIIPSCGQVAIHHQGGYYSTYVHMNPILVRNGQTVKAGDVIGKIYKASNLLLGCTATGPHLHFNTSKGSPYDWIKLVFVNSSPYPESIANPPIGYNIPLGSNLGPKVDGPCP